MADEQNRGTEIPALQGFSLPAAVVRAQLERILDSPEFQATGRQRDFLSFVVEEAIAGRADCLKGFTIATRVFGRGEDFDQATDPIVSIQANRLRRALERYYLVVGGLDPVLIDIPKGTYVPTFRENPGQFANGAGLEERVPCVRTGESWPTVVIRPFRNLNADDALGFLSIGMATELAMELTRYQDLRVLRQDTVGRGAVEDARFAIEGSIRKDSTGIKMTVQLLDNASGTYLWSDTYGADLDAGSVIAFQEETARLIAARVCSEHGLLVRTLSLESRSIAPATAKTYEAILLFHEFETTLEREAYFRALQSLSHAVETEPTCGKAWSMLARLTALSRSLEVPDIETSLEEALGFAERGIQLNPANQHARLTLAYVRFFMNDLEGGIAEIERALALNPESLIFLDAMGYLLTLMGDWSRGTALIRKAMRLNPYYLNTVHYALWVDLIRREEYGKALREALNLTRPALFWQPLVRAATLGLLGRTEEGRCAAQSLVEQRPDFRARGRVLIGHYVKCGEIVDRTVAGLRAVGVEVE